MQKNIREQKTVSLTLTEDCNLNCIYCYEKHNKNRVMSIDTAKEILDKELTVEDGTKEVYIDLFGGEPFLEFELIKKF